MNKKTIFIAAYQGFASRYLLQGSMLKHLLLSPEIHLVVLVRKADCDRVRQIIGSDRILIRPVEYEEIKSRHAQTLLGPRLSQIRQCVLDLRGNPASGYFWQDDFLRKYAKLSPLHKISQLYFITCTALLRRFRWLRRFLRSLEAKVLYQPIHGDLFEEFNPCLLVLPSLGYFEVDCYLVREARKRNVPTCGIVVNWDHTVSKGTSGAIPDQALVWGEKMREEVILHHDMRPDAIQITGPAHYDHYFDKKTYRPREEFCRQHNLDPARPIVLYAGMSPRPYPYNPDVIETLAKICADDRIGVQPQIFVRLHPNYHQLKFERPDQWQKESKRFRELKAKYSNLVIEEPEIKTASTDTFDLTEEDKQVLANTLFHASVVVCFFSTLNLEAAMIDKPVINCCIYGYRGGESGEESRVLEFSHLQNMIHSGSSSVAFTADDLREKIVIHLQNPAYKKRERQEFVQCEIGNSDGKASERVATAILKAALISHGSAQNLKLYPITK